VEKLNIIIGQGVKSRFEKGNCCKCKHGVYHVTQTGICEYKTIYKCAIAACDYQESEP